MSAAGTHSNSRSTGAAGIFAAARADFLQRVRSFRFLVVLMATVALGMLMLPTQDAGYVVLQVGQARGIYGSAWVGLVFGVIGSVILPLLGFFVIKDALARDRSTRVGLVLAVADEAKARQVAEHRRAKQRESELATTSKVSLEDLYSQIQAGGVKELKLVLKADVQGSVEAIRDALTRLGTDEVKLTVIHASVGGITESDVMLAAASNAIVIGFNVRPESKAADLAGREGVDIRLYNIIYEVVSDIRDALEGLLEPTLRDRSLGRAEVRQVFSVPSAGKVAGCFITDGKIVRGGKARLVRDHVVIHDGKIDTLRRFKDDAREVAAGYECGLSFDNFTDVKEGDVVEAYDIEAVARQLAPSPRSIAGGGQAQAERRV